MSRKWRERKKEIAEGKEGKPAKSAEASEALRRRRNRRFLFIAAIGLSFPILEFIAYQFRAITITFVNRSDLLVKGIKVTYSGGAFDAPELKPGGSLTRLIRPNFDFKGEQFSTYMLSIRYSTEDGQVLGQMGRVGALDYSAQEVYTIVQTPPEGKVQLQHMTRPGFPLSLVRDIMGRLGFG
jgi:hypothetical protein